MPNGKPMILVIWGDDIGISNLSCDSDGLMGYRTPNIGNLHHADTEQEFDPGGPWTSSTVSWPRTSRPAGHACG